MTKKTEKVEKAPEPPLGIETHVLKLTKVELAHIRDVLGLLLPPDMTTSLSQALAAQQQRSLEESRLWAKIAEACAAADIPMGDEAPDFTVSINGPPPIGVFQLAHALPDKLQSLDKEELQNLLD